MDNKTEHSTSHTLATQVVKVFSAIEASSEAVFITNTKGHIEYANKKFLDINELTEEKALGSSISKIPHSGNIALKLLEALKKGQSWSMRHQIHSHQYAKNNDSDLIWVRTSVDPIIEVPGEISGYIGVQRVINEEVLRELQSKKELAKILGLAIGQEKVLKDLRKSHDEALQQVVTKSTFLASMSHEIRTPLNGVLGMTELLQNTNLSNKQTHLTDIIQQSGQNLLNLINDILDLSKIEAGKLELNNSCHDLRILMEEVASTFAERASSKGLELTCIYPANDHSLFVCDKQRIVQILSNLISNAIKFTDEGEVVLEVSIDQSTSPNINNTENLKLFRFEIRDTGAGIPEDDQESIFESFSQSQQTREHASKGTGLGLTICKHLAELMGGEIGVISTKGQGSIFWFTTLLEKDNQAGTQEITASKEQLLSGLKVLVVDKNTSNSENIAHQLEQWNMQTVTTSSAQAAIELLEQADGSEQHFSLAILDHDMPDISGLKLAKILKKNKKFSEMPLIMMNSISDLEETMVWTSAGIKSYLTKPVKQAELYHSLLAIFSLSERKISTDDAISELTSTIPSFDAHILVAEDNPVNQELAELMLKEHGCKVTIVSDGKKALKVLDQNKDQFFDLILMDCQMPRMDGYTATKAIRENRVSEHHLPIIALTASAMAGDRQRCLEAGMDDYMTKPFSRIQLSQMLGKWLAKKDSKHDIDMNPQTEKDNSAAENTQIEDITPITIDQKEPEKAQVHVEKLNRNTISNIQSLQREGAPDILEKIIGLYLDNSSNIIVEIEQSVKNKDAKKIRSAVHSLKSSSANLGADSLADLCKEIELLGKNNQLDEIDQKFDQLKQKYELTCKALLLEIN